MATSYPSASSLGISGTGDQTANLNAALGNANYSGITFDFSPPTAITINGAVTAGNKVLKFLSGNTITGSGSIDGAVIEAGYDQKIFNLSLGLNLSLSKFGSTTQKLSVVWFGADRTGTATIDSKAAIQAAVTCAINNSISTNYAAIKTVFFPSGSYYIFSQIIAANVVAGSYAFFTIFLEGESSFWESSNSGTRILANFSNTFAFGIQLGKGCKIRNLYIQGKFTPPFTSGYAFYSATFASFTDTSCNDTTHAPYSAIVIDPFSNSSSQIPTDYYPGLSAYYQGTGGNGGSTGIEIEDVSISNFVVGICLGPNGFTRNNELHRFYKTQFTNCKLAISGNSDQDKNNVVDHLGCWGGTHTIFGTGLYGAQLPGNWYITNINLAGAVNQIIYNVEGGYFPSYFRNLFCESVGKFGTIAGSLGALVESSELGFVSYDASGSSGLVDWHITAGNQSVTFKSCSIRMYGTFKPITIMGNCIFEHCAFEAVPFVQSSLSYLQQDMPQFINCTADSYLLGATGDHTSTGQYLSSAYGNYSSYDSVNYLVTYYKRSIKFESAPLFDLPYPVTANITVSGASRQFTFTVANAGVLNFFPVGSLICYYNASGIVSPGGYIIGVNAGTLTVTVNWAAVSIPNGALSLVVPFPIYSGVQFLGDVTNGSNLITNVRADFSMNLANIVGTLVKAASAVSGIYDAYVLITAWNSTTGTLTMNSNSFYTQTGLYFSNNGTKSVEALTADVGVQGTELLQEGGWISMVNYGNVNGRNRKYKVIKSGYYDSSAVGGGETRRALFVPDGAPFEYPGNPEGVVAFPSGVTIRDTTTGLLYIKSVDSYATFNGGSTGWREYVDLIHATVQVSATTTLTLSITTRTNIFSGSSAATWTLPSIASNTGVEFIIKNRGSVNLILSRAGSDQIYNTSLVTSVTITPGQSLRVVNDGTYWDVN